MTRTARRSCSTCRPCTSRPRSSRSTGPGRHPGRAAEHHLRLPVRHRVQADLRGGPGRRRAGHVPAGRPDPAAGLVNGITADTQSHIKVPSVLLSPEWVTPANMNSTVIADDFVTAAQLCTAAVPGGLHGRRHQHRIVDAAATARRVPSAGMSTPAGPPPRSADADRAVGPTARLPRPDQPLLSIATWSSGSGPWRR